MRVCGVLGGGKKRSTVGFQWVATAINKQQQQSTTSNNNNEQQRTTTNNNKQQTKKEAATAGLEPATYRLTAERAADCAK